MPESSKETLVWIEREITMKQVLLSGALMALAVSLAPAAWAAGQVEVRFSPVDQLADVGRGRVEGERTVNALASHFRSLAARLPDGRTLTVEVTDVNLAGELWPTRHGSDVRVLAGRADWPTLDLRWTLSGDGKTLAQGQERLADMAYLQHALRGSQDRSYGYETRLIDRWFDERFGAAASR